ncbi:MAG: acyl-CoA thioesterase [Chlamydiia bacterium]|nr:acyl-CoA thioesterase [Chlamydiia bacterium]
MRDENEEELHKSHTVDFSAIEDHVYKVFPNDLNAHETVFGGLIMSLADRLAGIVAQRHSGTVCVTASVDSIHFLTPAGRGDVLIFKASINRVWNTSMEIGIKVCAQNYRTGHQVHVASAYFTFVALDDFHRPVSIPPLIPKTSAQLRRYQEAEIRRNNRKREAHELRERRQSEDRECDVSTDGG